MSQATAFWPALPATRAATHRALPRWTQIVGKTRRALSLMPNYWQQVPLYVTARGLSTALCPTRRALREVVFDFAEHCLRVHTSASR